MDRGYSGRIFARQTCGWRSDAPTHLSGANSYSLTDQMPGHIAGGLSRCAGFGILPGLQTPDIPPRGVSQEQATGHSAVGCRCTLAETFMK